MKFLKATSLSRDGCAVAAMWLFGLAGLVALADVAAGSPKDLGSWLKPFAPWTVGLMAYASRKQYR